PALDVVQVHRAAVAVRAALGLAVQLGHQLIGMRPLRERVPVSAMGGGDDVAVLERAANADRTGLLADRDVKESGQLSCAEALLDLLLETADQEHLPQHVLQVAFRQACALFDLCHGPECTVLPCRWSTAGTTLNAPWIQGGRRSR